LLRHWVAADVTDFRAISHDEQRTAASDIARNRSACVPYDEILSASAKDVAQKVADLDTQRQRQNQQIEAKAQQLQQASRAIDGNAIVGGAAPEDQPASVPWTSKVLESVSYQIQKDGSVLYLVREKPAFVDHGRHLLLEKNASDDEEIILAALLLAREKYGSSFDLTGSAEFKRRAIEVMVKHKIDATLKDSQLEDIRRQLSAAAPASTPSFSNKTLATQAARPTSGAASPGLLPSQQEAKKPLESSAAMEPAQPVKPVPAAVAPTPQRHDFIPVNALDWWTTQAAIIRMTAQNTGEMQHDLEQLGATPNADQTYWFDESGRRCPTPTELQLHSDQVSEGTWQAKSHVTHDQLPMLATHVANANGTILLFEGKRILVEAAIANLRQSEQRAAQAIADQTTCSGNNSQQFSARQNARMAGNAHCLYLRDLGLLSDRQNSTIIIPSPIAGDKTLEEAWSAGFKTSYENLRNNDAEHLPDQWTPAPLVFRAAPAKQQLRERNAIDSIEARTGVSNIHQKEFDMARSKESFDEYISREGWHEIKDVPTMARFLAKAKNRFIELDNANPESMPIAQTKAWCVLDRLFADANADLTMFFKETPGYYDLPEKDQKQLLGYANALAGSRSRPILSEHLPEMLLKQMQNDEPQLVLRGVKKLDDGKFDTTLMLFKNKDNDYLQGFVKIGGTKHQVLAHMNQRKADANGAVKPNFITLCELKGDGENRKWMTLGHGNAVNQRKDGKVVYFDDVLFQVANETLSARVAKNVDDDLHTKLGFVQKRIERPKDEAKMTSPGEAPVAKAKAAPTASMPLNPDNTATTRKPRRNAQAMA